MASECGSWFNHFVEICHGGQLKLSTYCNETKKFKLEETLTVTKDWYVCIQRKKYVCLQPKGCLFLIKKMLKFILLLVTFCCTLFKFYLQRGLCKLNKKIPQ